MKRIAVVILNCNSDIEFDECDVYKDSECSNNLNILDKLNRIGIKIREVEMKNDKEYKLIFIISEKKYNLTELPNNWFVDFDQNNILNEHDLYSDEITTGLNMKTSGMSYSLIITHSIPFNFISNFNRFQKEFEKLTKISNVNSALYTFCIQQKLKLFNYNLIYGKKKLI